MRRILIVKMWALGDILMATPLLRSLKSNYPGCHITWLTDKDCVGALENNPLIDHLIAFDSRRWRSYYRYGRWISYLKMSGKLVKDLKQRKFDISINLTAEKWWSVWFNHAPIRIGVFPRQRAGQIGRLYTTVILRSLHPFLHNSEHYALAATALGLPSPTDMRMVIGVSDADRLSAGAILDNDPAYDPSRSTLILHPGTSQVSKCWLPEQFADLIRRLPNYNFVLTGSAKERELCELIAKLAKTPIVIAAGQSKSLGQTAALIERAIGVVSGDTSILHITSALDIPLVAIYGSTRPNDNAPLFGRSKLLYDSTLKCAPCYKANCPLLGAKHMACMKNVTVNSVIDALNEMGVSSTEQMASNDKETSCLPEFAPNHA